MGFSAGNSLSEKLEILQVYRGIAALMVVIHHSVPSLGYYHDIQYDFLTFLASVGKYGVDFFFVLSGFIICYSNYSKATGSKAYSKYLTKRLLRVYIPYLPIGLAIYAAYWLIPSLSNSDRNTDLFTSITLIPVGTPALSVAWTLSFELLFYILFSLFFISKKTWEYFVGVWLISIVVVSYFIERSETGWFFDFLFSPYNLEFISGYLVCRLSFDFKYKPSTAFYILASAFGVLFLVLKFYHIDFFYFSTNITFAVFASFLIYYTVHQLNYIRFFAFFLLLGNISYSLYLVHNPIQAIIIRLSPFLFNDLFSLGYLLLLTFAVVIAVGYVYSVLFERIVFFKVLNFALRKRE